MPVKKRSLPITPAPRRWANASDDELVRGVRNGDESAFAELHGRYRAALERYAGGILGHRHPALDDVLQEVFHRAHAALSRPEARPLLVRPWLYRITHNRCIDELRSGRNADLDMEIDENRASAGDSLWGEVAARLTVHETLSDMASLPPRQRAALVAVAFEGRSHEQLAAELGTSIGASKSLVNRARGELVTLRAARAGGLAAAA